MYWGVASHYGRWTQEKHRKPIEQYTRTELAVYIADYISSKRFVHVDVNRIHG
jgi:HD superfamily phosphohydrolase YqeK